jgi:hypothetical protein
VTANQDPPAVVRPHVPEHLPAGPGAAVLIVGPRISRPGRAAQAGVDGPAPDPGTAEYIDALPVEALIDAADRARGSGRKSRQMQRPVKLCPGVGRAAGLDRC